MSSTSFDQNIMKVPKVTFLLFSHWSLYSVPDRLLPRSEPLLQDP